MNSASSYFVVRHYCCLTFPYEGLPRAYINVQHYAALGIINNLGIKQRILMHRILRFGRSATMNAIQVGIALKDLRKKRGITGVELARRAGMSQPKLSKIETGRYSNLVSKEIALLLNILDAPLTIRQQVLQAIDANNGRSGMHTTVRPVFSVHSGTLEKQAGVIRIFTLVTAPALLQTADFRRAYLKQSGLGDAQIAANMRNTILRQDELWKKDHRFKIVMCENALYTTLTDLATHYAQLDRLERSLAIPNVSLGIIPLQAGLPPIEFAAFALYDETSMFLALPYGEVSSTQKEVIDQHLSIFAEMERMACYRDDAVKLIRKAMDYFQAS